jgi:hypothetical protein
MPSNVGTRQSWNPSPTLGVMLQAVNVILSVHLDKTDIQTLGAMHGWIGGRPYNVGHVRVDKFYKSSSYHCYNYYHVLVVAQPTLNPAINFIGFECHDTPPYREAFQASAMKENISARISIHCYE